MMTFQGLHTLSVNLTDARGKWSDYRPNITIDGPDRVENFHEGEIQSVNLTAYIESVSKYGKAVIKFSKTMDTTGFELSDINSTVLDIYLIPHEDWHIDYSDSQQYNTI